MDSKISRNMPEGNMKKIEICTQSSQFHECERHFQVVRVDSYIK